jgi:hypothetical protein
MSALGHKQTFAVQKGMSALHLKADMCSVLILRCRSEPGSIRGPRQQNSSRGRQNLMPQLTPNSKLSIHDVRSSICSISFAALRSVAKISRGPRLISAMQREIASKYGKTSKANRVSLAPSGRRSKSGLPNSVSSFLIARVRDGCATPQRLAARVKLPSWQSARK